MRRVSLKTLKNKLIEYVRMASEGETIVVTDRDRVLAELVPPRAGQSPWTTDPVLAELVRKGWLSPSTSVGKEPPPSIPVTSFEKLMQELDRDREDR